MSDADPGTSERASGESFAQIAGAIAHDLNNLLTSIKGLSTLALREVERDNPIRQDLEEIEKASARAVERTRELLAAARRHRAGQVAGDAPATHPGAEDPSHTPVELKGSETILVAEDDPSIRRLLRRILDRAGYRVLIAEDATRAIALAEEAGGEVDLLLTDIVMPRITGEELFAQVHRKWPRVRGLYMSGYTDSPVVRREARNPDGGYLSKPFAPEVLLATIRRVLDSETHTR